MVAFVSMTLVLGLATAIQLEKVREAEIQGKLDELPHYAVGFFGVDSDEAFRDKLIKDTMGLLRLFLLTETSERVPSNGVLVFPAGTKNFRDAHHKAWAADAFDINRLVEFLDPLVTEGVEKVDGAIFQEWAQTKMQFGTKYVVVLIDNNPKKRHLGFRSLASIPEIKASFDLVWVNSNADKVKDVLRLEKFPSVMTLTMVQGKGEGGEKSVAAMPYKGPNVSFGYLHGWMMSIIKQAGGSAAKEEETTGDSDGRVPEFSDEITIMTPFNTEKVLADCEKVQCVLGFENYWLDDSVRFEKTVSELKAVQKGFNRHGLRVVLIDGGCHQNLLETLGLQLEFLPGLVLYNAAVPEYTPLMGKFEEKSIKEFVRKANAKIYRPNRLAAKLQIQARDCEAERAKWEAIRTKSATRSEEDDELMREVMNEIKKKEEEKKFEKNSKRKRRRSEDL